MATIEVTTLRFQHKEGNWKPKFAGINPTLPRVINTYESTIESDVCELVATVCLHKDLDEHTGDSLGDLSVKVTIPESGNAIFRKVCDACETYFPAGASEEKRHFSYVPNGTETRLYYKRTFIFTRENIESFLSSQFVEIPDDLRRVMTLYHDRGYSLPHEYVFDRDETKEGTRDY